MELRQLEYFLAVSELKSFTKESVAKPIFKRIIHSPKYGTIEKL